MNKIYLLKTRPLSQSPKTRKPWIQQLFIITLIYKLLNTIAFSICRSQKLNKKNVERFLVYVACNLRLFAHSSSSPKRKYYKES